MGLACTSMSSVYLNGHVVAIFMECNTQLQDVKQMLEQLRKDGVGFLKARCMTRDNISTCHSFHVLDNPSAHVCILYDDYM